MWDLAVTVFLPILKKFIKGVVPLLCVVLVKGPLCMVFEANLTHEAGRKQIAFC
jgi:hypothetical protein